MTFDDLKLTKPLRNALDDMGYVNPTPIQRESFSPISSGADIVGIAQTGTGKTFAFLLPILRLWKHSQELNPKVAIIVPTRELVVQIVSEINKLTTYMSINTFGVYGGTNINTQKEIIFQGIDIIVGTPGRFMDLSMSGALKLKKIKHFIIDEVDEMLELGFRVQLTNILDMLPEKRQNLLFSATLSEEVESIIKTFFNQARKIEIAKTGTPLSQIEQSLYFAPNFYTKINLLRHLLNTNVDMTRVLVFIRSKKLSDKVYELLTEEYESSINVIHSNKSQNQRLKSVSNFEKGEVRILIATDVIARGVDIDEVSHVINFDMPEISEIYMHRIGRTGRADKRGNAISFVSEGEMEYLMQIESLMSTMIEQLDMPSEVVVSEELLEGEKIVLAGDKHYRKEHKLNDGKNAYHEKSVKNSKVNLGGSYHRKPKKTKPVNRAGKKRTARRKKGK